MGVEPAAKCKNQGGDVHPWSAGCLVERCTAEQGEACRFRSDPPLTYDDVIRKRRRS